MANLSLKLIYPLHEIRGNRPPNRREANVARQATQAGQLKSGQQCCEMKILQLQCSRSTEGYVSYKFRAPASIKHMYMYVCACVKYVCVTSYMYLPVCVSSEACLSARVAHFNVIACACLAATWTAHTHPHPHPHPVLDILGSCFVVVVVALVSLCSAHPASHSPADGSGI